MKRRRAPGPPSFVGAQNLAEPSVSPALIWAVFAALALFTSLAIRAALYDAPNFDEAVHLASGLAYLRTGSYEFDITHPPLVRIIEALPLAALGVSVDSPRAPSPDEAFQAADRFLFHNDRPPETLLRAGRFMAILLGLCTIVLAAVWARQELGPVAAGVTAAALALEPTMLAHGHLATNDMGFCFFVLLALYLSHRAAVRPGPGRSLAAGAGVGLAIASKFTGLALAPLCGALLLGHWIRAKMPARRLIPLSALACLGTVLTILAVYRFDGWTNFADGLKVFHELLNLERPSFLWGRYGTHGWWWYYLAAFSIKTPLPWLGFLAWSCLRWRREPRRRFLLVWCGAPVAVFFAIASFSPVQIGIRYLLPIYPLLALVMGAGAETLWRDGRPSSRILGGMLAAWLLAETLTASPHFIAYFNELIGGSSQGYKYLADSNLDWGQELAALGAACKARGIGAIYLSYFGTADPAAYGIRYQPVFSFVPVRRVVSPIRMDQERPLWLAVSATNLQGVYSGGNQAFQWLQGRQPVLVLGHTLFVYDITDVARTGL